MAERTLEATLKKALSIGPLSTLEERLKYELRDFFAHEVMRYEQNMIVSDKSTEEVVWKPEGARDLFDRIFKDIPAFKTKS